MQFKEKQKKYLDENDQLQSVSQLNKEQLGRQIEEERKKQEEERKRHQQALDTLGREKEEDLKRAEERR